MGVPHPPGFWTRWLRSWARTGVVEGMCLALGWWCIGRYLGMGVRMHWMVCITLANEFIMMLWFMVYEPLQESFSPSVFNWPVQKWEFELQLWWPWQESWQAFVVKRFGDEIMVNINGELGLLRLSDLWWLSNMAISVCWCLWLLNEAWTVLNNQSARGLSWLITDWLSMTTAPFGHVGLDFAPGKSPQSTTSRRSWPLPNRSYLIINHDRD